MINPIILAGAFLGWGLGANDSANVFGTAVYSRVIKYTTAVILTAICVVLGAILNGSKGLEEIGNYAYNSGIVTQRAAFLAMLAAAFTVAVMTILKLPVSTSQAVIGAIIGGGLLGGTADFGAATKFFGAWILTPVGGMIIAFIIHKLISFFLIKKISTMRFYELFIKIGYLAAGMFGAYSLGANNVANVMGIFVGLINVISIEQAVLIGGISIAIGALTYSKPVMSTVGEKIVPLSPIEGLIVVIAASTTVFTYAIIGIPVSTSQAVIGAIIGIGLSVSANTINFRMLRNVFFGWFGTPTIAGIVSLMLSYLLV